MKYAPILIPTLNRYDHFKRCIDSLAKNKHAKETELYIALDFPLNETHWEGYNKIIEFVDIIKGFKTINIIKRKRNFGAILNIKEGRKVIFQKYDSMIFSEDDNEFSPNFLEYINKGLKKYEFDQNVSAICAYRHPIKLSKNYSNNFFFYKGFSAWGYATWRHKPIKLEYSLNELKNFIKNRKHIIELNNISGRHYKNIIESIVKNKNRRGDFAVFLNNIEKKQSCVFPVISKVRNHGHDGSGINCVKKDKEIFISQEIDEESHFDFSFINPLHNDKKINYLFKMYFTLSSKGKIKNIFFKIFFYLKRIFN